jgi:hypothetical protein
VSGWLADTLGWLAEFGETVLYILRSTDFLTSAPGLVLSQ